MTYNLQCYLHEKSWCYYSVILRSPVRYLPLEVLNRWMQNFQLWTIDILQIKSVWKSWQGLRNSQLTADTHVSLDDVSRMSMKRQRERQNQKYKAICFCHRLIEVNFSSSIKVVFETHHACSLGALGSKEVRKKQLFWTAEKHDMSTTRPNTNVHVLFLFCAIYLNFSYNQNLGSKFKYVFLHPNNVQ